MQKYKFYDGKFYPYSLKESFEAKGVWPSGGVDVDEATHADFTGFAPDGKIRITTEDGMPAWGDIPPPTHDELVERASIQKKNMIDDANNHINSKQWPGKAAIGRLKGDDLIHYNLWLDYLDALEVVDSSTAPDITWPIYPTV